MAYSDPKMEKEYDHPFIRLLKKPNSQGLTQFELFEAWQSYLELVGDFFLYVAKGENTSEPKELFILRPDRVEVLVDENSGDLLGYKYKPDDVNEVPFDIDEIIHDKTFNPYNPYRGLGTVQAGLLYIEGETVSSEFQTNFIKNQATPSGIVSFKNRIGKEAFDKFKTQWAEQHQGQANAGKTAFIRQADIEFTKLGLSLSDLNLEGLKTITDTQVRQLFRVPKAILGETDSSGLGRANIEAVEYIFAKRTIEPKLDSKDDKIKESIERFYGEELYIGHTSQVPADKEFRLKEDKELVDVVKTRNQIRKERGYDDFDGADDLYLAFNQVSLSQPQRS
jgi:HK97 family phage portal protein